jgi:SAM-dependent methyltransferase
LLRNFVRPGGATSSGLRVRAERGSPRREHEGLIQRVAGFVRPDDEALLEWYSRYAHQQGRRLAHDLDLVTATVPTGHRVLDLGAAPPILCAALSELGYAVKGVDIDPTRFGQTSAALGLDVRRCNIETEALPCKDASVDAVVLHEVFEHLRIDLIATFEEIARVLRPGGLLLVSTPNLLSLSGMLNLLVRGRAQAIDARPFEQFEKLRTLGHMGHVREYTTVEVCEFVARFDLVPQELVFRGRDRGIKGWMSAVVPRLRPIVEVVARRVESRSG